MYNSQMKIILFILITNILLFADIGILKKVVDGDTLYFTNDKCRILYIDTPESMRNKKAKKDAKRCKNITLDTMVKMGKEATNHAKTLLKIGKSYKYDVLGQDRYKRSLCIVYTPKGVYNELIVKDGYAVAFERYLPKSVKRKYLRLEREAKSANRGLWKKYNMDCLGN
jgi:micrococcal nuclease